MINADHSEHQTILLLADELGVSYDEAADRFKQWRFAGFGGVQHCVYDQSVDGYLSIPIYLLVMYGDTEEAAQQYIKRHMVGTQRDASIPWLTDHGREELAWELQNGKQRPRYDPRNKRYRG